MKTLMKPIIRMANHPRLLAAVIFGSWVLAAIVFMVASGASLIDSLYWSMTTMSTVGYGDMLPINAAGKMFAIAFQAWSIFVLVPCAVTNIIDSVRIDEHKQTHEEQEWEFERIERICEALDIPAVNQPKDY